MHDYQQAAAYIQALTGQPVETAELWFRAIHDADKAIPAHKLYGTLPQLWQALTSYNAQGFGIFANVNAFASNAATHNLADVWYVRAHVIDLDNVLTAQQSYDRAATSQPAPSFAVQTSPGKMHVYWSVAPYQGNERYTTLQRKLVQVYGGDRQIIDPTRVLRVAGFFNHKYSLPASDKFVAGAQPHLVTSWALNGYGQPLQVETLETAYQHVNVIDGHGGRHELGDPDLAAPSLDWLRFGLSLIDPNQLDRAEWISTTAAVKQAGWTLATDEELFSIWSEWCTRYAGNDEGENRKQWNSIRETEVGWKSIERRAPTLAAYMKLGRGSETAPAPVQPATLPPPSTAATATDDDAPDTYGDILSEHECKEWFKGCYWVRMLGKILVPDGRFLNSTQFNGDYGGKLFVITSDGKTTDEPWKAATRSTLWTIPKVDHIRFLPDQAPMSVIKDQLGRKGINTYKPIILTARPGDVTPFLRHMEFMLPDENDRRIVLEYFAHNVKFPGHKIFWAPLIQSAEGVGKGIIQKIASRMLGEMYTYSPPADQLIASGSVFNAWQREKLFIVVNEVKIDERRELIEIMKPWITDDRIQIQGKGTDQMMEDNPANWLFFSNYKNAIPISQNGRRWSVFYSAIQSAEDLKVRGMGDAYFTALTSWLDNGGYDFIWHWLLNYPIERGSIPKRAPDTSSREEAIKVSRGPIEVAILNCVEDGAAGFRGGYVSLLAVMNRLKQLGGRTPSLATVQTILETMGYHELGRANRQFGQESMNDKTTVYAILRDMPIEHFGRIQGYE